MATTSSSVSTTVASLVQGLDVSSQVSSMILQQEQCNRNRELNLRIKALLGFLLRVKKMWEKRKRLVGIEGNYDFSWRNTRDAPWFWKEWWSRICYFLPQIIEKKGKLRICCSTYGWCWAMGE